MNDVEQPSAAFGPLVETDWLASELGAPDLRVICMVFTYPLPDGSRQRAESGRAAREAGIDIRDPTADVDLVADQELIQELSERYRAVACAAWRSLSGCARRWLALLLLPDTDNRRARRIRLEQDPSFEVARAQVQVAYGEAMTRLFRGQISAPSRRRAQRHRPAVHGADEAAPVVAPGTIEYRGSGKFSSSRNFTRLASPPAASAPPRAQHNAVRS